MERRPPASRRCSGGSAAPGPSAAPPRPAPPGRGRSVPNALEKHRRAQLRGCPERLKQQVPVGAGPARPTTLSLLHRARLHIQRLEEQELSARRAKDRLHQQSLRRQLEQLLSPVGEKRARADSLDSSRLSEPSEGEDAEIEADGAVFAFSTGRDHSYSSPRSPTSGWRSLPSLRCLPACSLPAAAAQPPLASSWLPG